MFIKTCPDCNYDSYGSYDKGTWICPYCQCEMQGESECRDEESVKL